MPIQLPPFLQEALNRIGSMFPGVDETELAKLAIELGQIAARLTEITGDLAGAAGHVALENDGPTTEKFIEYNAGKSNATGTGRLAAIAAIAASTCAIAAGLVVALKVATTLVSGGIQAMMNAAKMVPPQFRPMAEMAIQSAATAAHGALNSVDAIAAGRIRG